MTGTAATASQDLPGAIRRGAGAAPWWRRTAAAAWWDVRTIAGNGEQLLATLIIPVALLVAVVRSGVPDLSPLDQGAGGLAAALAVAAVSSAFTGQSIALAFDRRAGLLRLLIASPLGRAGVVAGRLTAVAVLVTAQSVVLLGVALALRVDLALPAVAATAVVMAVGAMSFAAFGMLLGGTLRAEAVLAVANLAWLAMVSLGGLVVPSDRLPGSPVVALLPPALFGDAVRTAVVDARVDALAVGLLAAWGAAAGLAAARLLRWD